MISSNGSTGNMHKIDVLAGLSYLAGPQLTTVALAFGDAWPGHDKQIVAVAGGIVFSAGLLARLFRNPSQSALPPDVTKGNL